MTSKSYTKGYILFNMTLDITTRDVWLFDIFSHDRSLRHYIIYFLTLFSRNFGLVTFENCTSQYMSYTYFKFM